jgi:hypothetical protein
MAAYRCEDLGVTDLQTKVWKYVGENNYVALVCASERLSNRSAGDELESLINNNVWIQVHSV